MIVEKLCKSDGELYKIGTAGKYSSIYYRWVNNILTSQYNKEILWVDSVYHETRKLSIYCHGAKLRKESLAVKI